MDILSELFGEGKDLTSLQMIGRGVVIFFVAFLLIRISGRRSFGIRTPLDNIIAISLGAILSRAVVGASPFVPTVLTSLVIVLLHRFFSWIIVSNRKLNHIAEGEKILLFQNGKFIPKNMDKALICQEDIMQGVRKSALTADLDKIEIIFMERNGEITCIRKDE